MQARNHRNGRRADRRWLAVLLITFSLTTVATIPVLNVPAAQADVGTPSWWNGDCDANHWNSVASGAGWRGAGAHRLGAAYLGVPVCGPRPKPDAAPDVLWSKSGWGEYEWECTELAFRFMSQIYGVSAYSAQGQDVVSNYTTSAGGGLVKVSNGTAGVAPLPGDVVSFRTSADNLGHVAVVASSAVDGNGNGSVTLISQNDTADGWRTLAVSGWKLQGFEGQVPYGWLHDPAGRGGKRHADGDYNGDGKTDIAVFRASTGVWYIGGPGATSTGWGIPGDVPVPGDYNGDGKTDVAVFRPSNGGWYIGGTSPAYLSWGGSTDVPAPADYNGDGKTDIAVFRPANGTWYIGGPTAKAVQWGVQGDVPVPGDYDGDGKADVAVFRPSNGGWYIGGTNPAYLSWGANGDIPVPGDYNGDGRTDIAVFRPSTGVWYIGGPSPTATAWGEYGDVPVPGDYNGDGKTDIAVFRPRNGIWYIGGANPASPAWGARGDVALPRRPGDQHPFGSILNSSSWVPVHRRNSGKCVDAQGAGTADGTPIQQYECNGTNAQSFQFQPTSDGYYRAVNRNATSQVWDVSGISTADTAKIQLWGWNGGGNQQWMPIDEGNGYVHFIARHSGKCLDVPSASIEDGVQLQQWTCNGTAAQSFTVLTAG